MQYIRDFKDIFYVNYLDLRLPHRCRIAARMPADRHVSRYQICILLQFSYNPTAVINHA